MTKIYWFLLALLVAILAGEILRPVAPPAARGGAPGGGDGEETALLNSMDYVLGFAPASVDPEILKRPLFFKERRPPPPFEEERSGKKPVTPSRPAAARPRVSLKAIVGVGGKTTALISEGGGQEVRRVSVGENIGGWRVNEILSDKLLLVSGSEKLEIPLRAYKPFSPPRKTGAPPAGKDKAGPSGTKAVKRAVRPSRRAKAAPRKGKAVSAEGGVR